MLPILHAEHTLRALLVFVLLLGCSLFYLWEHAYSFRLSQEVGILREQKRRSEELVDSLSACLAHMPSTDHTLEDGTSIPDSDRERVDKLDNREHDDTASARQH
jgi:hypothetical protein